MAQTQAWQTILGVLIWIGIFAGILLAFNQSSAQAPSGMRQLWQFAGNQRIDVQLEFEEVQLLAVGDLIFSADTEDYKPIGMISFIPDIPAEYPPTSLCYTRSAKATFFGCSPPLRSGDFLNYHRPADDMAWVIRTMLPQKKRDEISKLILESYELNRETLIEAYRPILAQSFNEAAEIIQEDFAAALRRRDTQWDQISQRYQQEFVEQKLVPLIQEELWPIVRREAEPLIMEIGREIWQELSLFRFAWRYLYDRSLDPDESLTKQELNRFVENKITPIIESHIADFVQVQNRIVHQVATNQRTRSTAVEAVKQIVADESIQALVREIFQEVLIDNQRLQQAMEAHWNTPQAQAVVQMTNQRLEPTIASIGVALFGSTSDAITPEFARVLRHRILHKDSRWLTLVQNGKVETRPGTSAEIVSSTKTRAQTPSRMTVRTAEDVGQIPYAPARSR